MTELKGKTAIITGGGSGIGEGAALALAKEGVRIVLCGRREAPLQKVAAEIQARGGQALTIMADVSQVQDVETVVETAVSTFDSVHILINNAGIAGMGRIHEHSIDLWDKIMAINLRGPFLMARVVLPLMRQQKSGHIINISSESGLEYYPGNGAYGVSKHALNALSEYMQRENQDLGIRIDTVCPGMVITEMTENSPGLNYDNCLYPEDIAELIRWLVTRRSNIKIGRPVLIQTMGNPWQV